MQPVLETYTTDNFTLWPAAEMERFGFLALSGALEPAEVGAAVMAIAACNDIDPELDTPPRSPRPTDPVGSFLHGLLTMDPLFAAGGLRVTDTVTGTTFAPGCCNGLEDWRDWLRVANEGGTAGFGHEPSPGAERLGDVVRLILDFEDDDSPEIELPVTELRHLLTGAERDLTDFHQLATGWAAQHLPDHALPVTAALARALDLPAPVVPPGQ